MATTKTKIGNFEFENCFMNAAGVYCYDRNDLEEVPSRQAFYEIDKLFNVVYINSSINLEYVFKRYTKELFLKQQNISDLEKSELEEYIKNLNTSISNLKSMNELKTSLKAEYSKYREEKDSASVRRTS